VACVSVIKHQSIRHHDVEAALENKDILKEIDSEMHFTSGFTNRMSRITLGNGLDDRDSMVRFPAAAGNFSLLFTFYLYLVTIQFRIFVFPSHIKKPKD
jgi:hypothetical protein